MITAPTNMLTLGLAALELRVQVHTLQKLANQNMIPYIRAGRFRLVDRAHLDAIRDTLVKSGRLPVVTAPSA